jgi:hypothetical protein
MTAVVAVATCCGSIAAATLRGSSLVAATVLPVTRGALDERRLMGMDASDLSALAGARGGRSTPPYEHKNRKIKLLPLENGASGAAIAYLKVEKPRILFLEGSTGAAAATDVATVALSDASVARAASSIDRPAAGAAAPPPGAFSSAASTALVEGGAGSHLSGGRPTSLSSSSSSPDDEYSEVAGGESPCCSCSRNSSSLCFRRSRRRILCSF